MIRSTAKTRRWPRILRRHSSAALLLAAAMLAGPPHAAGQTPSPGDLDALRRQALEAVNKDRRAHDLPPLELGKVLNTVAQNHAEDMYRKRYYAHTSPSGVTVRDRYLRDGGSKWRLVAENIARCKRCSPPPTGDTVTRLQRGWMHSPEHRANILHRGLTRFGYGIVVDAGQGLYGVQTFAGPGVSRGLAKGETAEPIEPAQRVQVALRQINRARDKAGRAALRGSDALTTAARNVLPEQDLENFDLASQRDLFDALPQGARTRWRAVSALSAACGGCGREATAADVRAFVKQWLQNPKSRATLTSRRFSGLGFALATNRQGKKVAFLLLGEQR